MTNAAEDYDDFLDEGGHRWRKRLILLAVAAALVIAVVATLWATLLRDGGTTAAQTQTATVTRGSIVKSISTSATTASQSTANLSFGQSGLVTAVNVKVGQAVNQGDVLATVESQTLQDAVTRAQVSLNSAQTKLNTMLKGSLPADLASADQSVIQAQANLDKANTALQDLYSPTSDAVSSAQQAVLSAQSQLTKAQQARAAVDTNWSDAVSTAQAAVDKAKSAKSDADDALSLAEAKLKGAEASYCTSDSSPSFCQSADATPISASDETTLTGLASGAGGQQAQNVLSANNAYKTAQTAYNNAVDALQTAKDNLSKLGTGPSSDDVSVADASVQSAQLALQSANDKLAALSNPSADDVNQAQSNVDSATAALTAAQAKRDTTYQGSTPEDIAAQRDQVTLAQIGVDEANKNLKNAQLIAPFEGTVAAVNINVGDTAGSGGTSSASSSSTSAIVLNTPNALVLNVSVGESDLPNVTAGQTGTATFDAISGRVFPIVIDSIGTNPTTTQGVVTYQARAHMVSGQATRAGAGAQSGSSSASPAPGASQSQAQATPGATATASAQPAPGMNASVTIVVDQRQNVLMVPNSAIQRDGRNDVVNVQNDDGSTSRQTVETGLTNGTNTEIIAGLDEGQTIIIPGATASTTTSSQATSSRTTGSTGGSFFGGGGGGADIPGVGGVGR